MKQIFKNIFHFHGTINNEGKINEIEGKILDEDSVDIQSLIGKGFLDTYFLDKESLSEKTFENILQDAEKGKVSTVTLNISSVNNIDKTIELIFVPIKENEDDSENIFFCASDITSKEKEIKFYKERSEHLLFAAENAGVGLWFCDLVTGDILTTPKFNQLFELQPDDTFTLEDFYKAMHPDDHERIESEIKKSHETGVEYNVEYRVIHSDGNKN